MIWEIVIIVCVSDSVILSMICDGSVMVMSTSQRQHKHLDRYKCSISTHIILTTLSGVRDERKFLHHKHVAIFII